MKLWSDQEGTTSDLEHTCQILGIPFYRLDFEAEFQSLVIDYFCREYDSGRTPNPCTACNQHIKFGLLLDKVLQMRWGVAFENIDRQISCFSVSDLLWLSAIVAFRGYKQGGII
ncbi:tRNA-specific 2-thiouridylase MnmA [subsurface metagenome]